MANTGSNIENSKSDKVLIKFTKFHRGLKYEEKIPKKVVFCKVTVGKLFVIFFKKHL